jgi:hypothetical protein
MKIYALFDFPNIGAVDTRHPRNDALDEEWVLIGTPMVQRYTIQREPHLFQYLPLQRFLIAAQGSCSESAQLGSVGLTLRAGLKRPCSPSRPSLGEGHDYNRGQRGP